MSGTPEVKKPRGPARAEADGNATAFLDRAVLRARRVLAWERAWPVIATALVVLAAFLAVSWTGLWLWMPPLARMIGVALFSLALLGSLFPLIHMRWPRREEALSRLDRESHLAHRPATAISDALATRADDPVSAALWRAHVAKTLAAARNLKAGLPAPGLAARDPRAFRALAVLALFATFFLAGGERWSRIESAFDWSGAVIRTPYRLDAWVDPPAYTGRPPVVLPGLRSDDPTTLQATALSVPAGSVLVVRAVGLDASALKIEGGIAELKPQEDASQNPPETPSPAATPALERRFEISQAGTISLAGPDRRSVTWKFSAVPDTKPTIAFAKEPQGGQRNQLVLAYRVEDDYGAKSARAVFQAAPPPPPFFPRPGAPAPVAAKPLVEAPDFDLALPGAGSKTGAAQTQKDLVAHPWAGALVHLTLKVEDEAGNTGESETKTFRLPARTFTKPLARALIEERQLLALDAGASRQVQDVLSALALAPDQFGIPPGQYLGLRSAYWRLHNARNDDDLRGVVDYLWDMALAIEDGDLSAAQKELRAAQQALRDALERGASDEEIKRLTQDLRAAMEKMMRQLAEEAQRNGNADARPLDQNSRVIRPQDLQRMLDRIENLARSGAKDAAKQLLDELQAMMDNLKPGNRQAGQQGQQGQSELGNMIQEQQRLRDRTYKQRQQQGQGQQGQDGEQGQEGENGAFGPLQEGQEGLRRRLGEMLDEMRRMEQQQRGQGQGQGQDQAEGQGQGQGQAGEGQGGEGQGGESATGRAGRAFGRAEQAMRDAERALGEGNAQGALDSQGRALQALRQGAQAMAEGQQSNPNGQGPGGPSGQGAQRTDPMGRPLRSQDYGDDYTVKVPEEVDVQRARQVLEELRRRLEQTNRPQLELDYIERLLENF
ncbi:TIGR02302 family protein [Xanthobacter sp. VTT E-85241]|uniref:TIGR02302 family protein n=1 Tax=Roseixanthobacter finlandensis TaxID=3119922 RepID=UPI00372927EF